MADRAKSASENVAGDFFVDRTCIDCDTCRQVAPSVFADAGDHSFVRKQPGTEAERREAFSGASLRSIIHGAAPCPPDVKRRMIQWVGPVVSEYYGGTEGGFIAMISASEWLERPGSVGRPLPIIEVAVK